MALVECKDCGGPLSTTASACPRCGSKANHVPKNRASFLKLFSTAAVISALCVPLILCSTKRPPPSPDCSADDLQCRGAKLILNASVFCPKHIERQARHGIRWNDSYTKPKFTHFRWLNKSTGTITMIGNSVEFQNGFGAFDPIVYECDIGADGKSVLDVRVKVGRL